MTNTFLKKTENRKPEIYSDETVRNYNMIKICSGVRCSMVSITATTTTAIITAPAHAYAYENETKNE